ncbi:MAG TPA: hypothetical protein VNY29_12120 [Terriglobales bacterium]|jgi:hypothetical protein|nr:hypothetical protein [Terriglobales bacterium]
MFHFNQHRDVTYEQATIDRKIVKKLFSYGTQTEGRLGALVGESLSSQPFKESLARLFDWQMVSMSPAFHGLSRSISLTSKGEQEAQPLVAADNAAAPTPAERTWAAKAALDEEIQNEFKID